MQFYKSNNRKRQGAHLPFNFQMIQVLNKDSKAKDIVSMVNDWFKLLPEGEVTNWAVSSNKIKISHNNLKPLERYFERTGRFPGKLINLKDNRSKKATKQNK